MSKRISPIYQAIQSFDNCAIPSSAQESSYFEPLLPHFINLKKAYQAASEQN